MRNTENLSLRLDPEVVRLARRTAEEFKQTLREFFEDAIRRHAAALTTPEEKQNLLMTLEQSLLRRIDERLHDAIERIAALSAKEATDQAQALQLMKRCLFFLVNDQKAWNMEVNRAWDEAVERVRKRGRPLPPEVVDELMAKITQWERWATDQTEAVKKTKAALEAAQEENINLKRQIQELKQQVQNKERDVAFLSGQHAAQDYALQREMWVSDQLEKQGMIGRKSAAEFRRIYTERNRETEASR